MYNYLATFNAIATEIQQHVTIMAVDQ